MIIIKDIFYNMNLNKIIPMAVIIFLAIKEILHLKYKYVWEYFFTFILYEIVITYIIQFYHIFKNFKQITTFLFIIIISSIFLFIKNSKKKVTFEDLQKEKKNKIFFIISLWGIIFLSILFL